MVATEPVVLESYLAGRWVRGSDAGAELVDPVTGEVVALASSSGLDLGAALRYARDVGRPALGALTYAQRAALLGAVADALQARRDDWYAIARRNSGNTKADAGIDVDGGIGTLKYYAKLGASLGEAKVLSDGAPARLARDPNFQALHLGVPIDGAAIHINAYNFPSWGLWEKAAVALLSGIPVVAKPATATAWLSVEMVRAVIDAGVLPNGALSLLVGSVGDLLDHVRFGDAIAFTGSAETGERIRSHPQVRGAGVRVNVEADSLNATLLGPDAREGTPVFELYVREIVREMSTKAGQKCTAIRRAIVPAARRDAVLRALARALDAVVVGDPATDGVTLGPLVSAGEARRAREGIAQLAAAPGASIAYTHPNVPAGEAFVAPTLIVAGGDAAIVHDLEVFAPVASVLTYTTPDEAYALARRGGGSLVVSVFSDDAAFLAQSALAIGASHGRVLLVDTAIGDAQTGHGIVMPSCQHGGPGRAGGGEELGGLRGLWFYHQRTAVQGPLPVLEQLAAQAVNPYTL
ncbi:MAG TPA: 3,4-dehydroadipyl-CoA semialdehyde dehydrogenase [Candidatus Sulfotelmatobacter sp.]|nr:3,4-dehydroadipyl-CoA semialdehyde dehydrogenase [Candidatus Sulfotelmatobacter sp.]